MALDKANIFKLNVSEFVKYKNDHGRNAWTAETGRKINILLTASLYWNIFETIHKDRSEKINLNMGKSTSACFL